MMIVLYMFVLGHEVLALVRRQLKSPSSLTPDVEMRIQLDKD